MRRNVLLGFRIVTSTLTGFKASFDKIINYEQISELLWSICVTLIEEANLASRRHTKCHLSVERSADHSSRTPTFPSEASWHGNCNETLKSITIVEHFVFVVKESIKINTVTWLCNFFTGTRARRAATKTTVSIRHYQKNIVLRRS